MNGPFSLCEGCIQQRFVMGWSLDDEAWASCLAQHLALLEKSDELTEEEGRSLATLSDSLFALQGHLSDDRREAAWKGVAEGVMMCQGVQGAVTLARYMVSEYEPGDPTAAEALQAILKRAAQQADLLKAWEVALLLNAAARSAKAREPLEEAGAEASLVLMTLASRLAEHLRGDQAGLHLGKKQLLKLGMRFLMMSGYGSKCRNITNSDPFLVGGTAPLAPFGCRDTGDAMRTTEDEALDYSEEEPAPRSVVRRRGFRGSTKALSHDEEDLHHSLGPGNLWVQCSERGSSAPGALYLFKCDPENGRGFLVCLRSKHQDYSDNFEDDSMQESRATSQHSSRGASLSERRGNAPSLETQALFSELCDEQKVKMRKTRGVTRKDVYELGDISKFLDGQAKAQVAGLIGKETYEFGDISREIARRAKEADDLLLLLRAVITMGVGLTPVAHLLPMQVLLNLRLGSNSEVAFDPSELDRRSKEALLGKGTELRNSKVENGNEDYVLGDLTRKQLQQSLRSITGKDNYEFGDISRSLLRRLQQGS
eukprot:symbB.v1.2.017986.t4/scaffold1416.1/size119947/6